MKTKEELNELKLECTTLTKKLVELNDEELNFVTGGHAVLETPPSNVQQALQGKAAGVLITDVGVHGETSKIVVRGVSSFRGSNEPLVVVDGVHISSND